MRKVVVNTTPLIALSHVGLLNLLKQLYGEIIIPEAVYEELAVKKGSVCEKEVNNSLSWIHVKKIENQMAKQMYKTQLHDGEVEVMILATGEAKAEATKAAIEGSVNHRWAVSALQMHRHGIYVCDEASASKLEQETILYLKDIERNAY